MSHWHEQWPSAVAAGCSPSLALPGLALADATPVQLILLYMPNVSNTGTTAAQRHCRAGHARGRGARHGRRICRTWTATRQYIGLGRQHRDQRVPAAGRVQRGRRPPAPCTTRTCCQTRFPTTVEPAAADGRRQRRRDAPQPTATASRRCFREPTTTRCRRAAQHGRRRAVGSELPDGAVRSSYQLSACGGSDWLAEGGTPALTLATGLCRRIRRCANDASHIR